MKKGEQPGAPPQSLSPRPKLSCLLPESRNACSCGPGYGQPDDAVPPFCEVWSPPCTKDSNWSSPPWPASSQRLMVEAERPRWQVAIWVGDSPCLVPPRITISFAATLCSVSSMSRRSPKELRWLVLGPSGRCRRCGTYGCSHSPAFSCSRYGT